MGGAPRDRHVPAAADHPDARSTTRSTAAPSRRYSSRSQPRARQALAADPPTIEPQIATCLSYGDHTAHHRAATHHSRFASPSPIRIARPARRGLGSFPPSEMGFFRIPPCRFRGLNARLARRLPGGLRRIGFANPVVPTPPRPPDRVCARPALSPGPAARAHDIDDSPSRKTRTSAHL
jgi:hypothetical protein